MLKINWILIVIFILIFFYTSKGSCENDLLNFIPTLLDEFSHQIENAFPFCQGSIEALQDQMVLLSFPDNCKLKIGSRWVVIANEKALIPSQNNKGLIRLTDILPNQYLGEITLANEDYPIVVGDLIIPRDRPRIAILNPKSSSTEIPPTFLNLLGQLMRYQLQNSNRVETIDFLNEDNFANDNFDLFYENSFQEELLWYNLDYLVIPYLTVKDPKCYLTGRIYRVPDFETSIDLIYLESAYDKNLVQLFSPIKSETPKSEMVTEYCRSSFLNNKILDSAIGQLNPAHNKVLLLLSEQNLQIFQLENKTIVEKSNFRIELPKSTIKYRDPYAKLLLSDLNQDGSEEIILWTSNFELSGIFSYVNDNLKLLAKIDGVLLCPWFHKEGLRFIAGKPEPGTNHFQKNLYSVTLEEIQNFCQTKIDSGATAPQETFELSTPFLNLAKPFYKIINLKTYFQKDSEFAALGLDGKLFNVVSGENLSSSNAGNFGKAVAPQAIYGFQTGIFFDFIKILSENKTFVIHNQASSAMDQDQILIEEISDGSTAGNNRKYNLVWLSQNLEKAILTGTVGSLLDEKQEQIVIVTGSPERDLKSRKVKKEDKNGTSQIIIFNPIQNY